MEEIIVRLPKNVGPSRLFKKEAGKTEMVRHVTRACPPTISDREPRVGLPFQNPGHTWGPRVAIIAPSLTKPESDGPDPFATARPGSPFNASVVSINIIPLSHSPPLLKEETISEASRRAKPPDLIPSCARAMSLLDHLWDDTVAGPTPESGLGKLRKHSTFSSRSNSGKGKDTKRPPPRNPRHSEQGIVTPSLNRRRVRT